jgi:hypothetical protein
MRTARAHTLGASVRGLKLLVYEALSYYVCAGFTRVASAMRTARAHTLGADLPPTLLVCVCECVCVNVCVHIQIYLPAYIYIYMYIYMCVYIYICGKSIYMW